MNQYHATPYDISASGFYFSTFDEFVQKAAKHLNDYGEHVEEYEIQFIDGDNSELFQALDVNQATLELWFDDFEDLDGDSLIAAIYLTRDVGYAMTDVMSHVEDVHIFEGTVIEYAQEYIEDTGLLDQIPENLQFYFDTEAFARDLVIGGDVTETRIQNTNFVVWGC